MNLLLHVECEQASDAFDVQIVLHPAHTVRDLAVALAGYRKLRPIENLALRIDRSTVPLSFDSKVEDVGLISGDTLLVDPPLGLQTPLARRAADLRLVVTSGADAGDELELSVGRHSVGRGNEHDLNLHDPQVSRRRDFALTVDSFANTVELDAGIERTNPLRLNGAVVEGTVNVVKGDTINVGSTSLAIRESSTTVRRPLDYFGSVPFHRTPYLHRPVEVLELPALGDIPAKPKPRRFQAVAIVAPLFTSVAMAFFSGSMRFLLLAALSPVIAAWTHFDNKRTVGKEHADALADLDRRIAKRRTEVEEAVDRERRARLSNAPDIVDLVNRAQNIEKELWARNRESTDFLHLRLGLGSVPASVTVKAESQGDKDLQRLVSEAVADLKTLDDVPVVINAADAGVLALVGERAGTSQVAGSLAIQAGCLHSPEDLIIASAVPHDRGLNEWLKWMPHVRSTSSPLGQSHLAGDRFEADLLVKGVTRVAESRVLGKDQNLDRRWPRILLILDRDLDPEPGTISRLFDLCKPAGISVIWLTDNDARVPRQATAIAHLHPPVSGRLSNLTHVAPEVADQEFDPDLVQFALAERAARALAPLRDASAANAAAAVPSTVTLFDALAVEHVTPQWIAEQWAQDRGYSLETRVGLADTGPVKLDLVQHGPHGLIGGTSGAGKSELVQSLVANLIALNSPERVNLLFVDYKGGALSGLFKKAPHNVGAVTNLDALLSLRALTSLKAELDRRMELFARTEVKDIREMLEKHPADAPPSLVIIVDEFASLVRERPEFVEGIVSIAERGRSLGIHLLLSTQRPSGSINENIQQNTNLRISLRMLDGGESNSVIGVPDAAAIPAHLKGRGFVRLGHGQLIAFQSAWSGAPSTPEAEIPPIAVASFTTLEDRRVPMPVQAVELSGAGKQASQLEGLLDAISQAASELHIRPGRAPWRDTLPTLVPLLALLNDDRAARPTPSCTTIPIGMVDDPEAQDQYPANVDLTGGGLVFYGSGGSGKTTALITSTMAAAIQDSVLGGGHLSVFGLDFASRQLAVLGALPQCELIANGDDMEAVTRLIAVLDREFSARQAESAAAAASHQPPPDHATVLLVIDGYDNLTEAFTASGVASTFQTWLDRLLRLISRGRQVGIYPMLATSSIAGPSGRLMSLIPNRFTLRQVDENVYRFFGLSSALVDGVTLKPGQAIDRSGNLMQIAAVVDPRQPDPVVGPGPVRALAERLVGTVTERCRTEPLPEIVKVNNSLGTGSCAVHFGQADLTLEHVVIDLAADGLLVIGPPRSGRSTALLTVGRQLREKGHEVWVVGPKGSELETYQGWTAAAFGRSTDILPVLEDLKIAAQEFAGVTRFLIFDDVNRFDDSALNAPLKTIIESGVRCVGSTDHSRNLLGSNPLAKELRTCRTLVVLKADDDGAIQASAGSRYQLRPGLTMPVGRGVLVVEGYSSLAQIAS